ncbi:MAG TPA: hypothetical protein VIA80_09175 [Hyphomonadaceae bacterium]
MSFPSLWLAVGGMLVSGLLTGWLTQAAATSAAKGTGNRHPLPGLLVNVLAFASSAWLFFAVTGNFPWPLVIGGVAMTLFGGVIVFMIYAAAGLLHPFRDRDINTLMRAFLKPVQQGLSVLPVALAVLVLPIVMIYLAFEKAHQVDLQSSEGLFEIGLLLLSIQTGFWFVLTNCINGFVLLSKETSRQQRIQTFAQSFRTYLISGWTAVYPFYAFRFDELGSQPLFVWAGAGLYLVTFLTFVLIPYLVGRTRYHAHKNKILAKVSDECRRVSIATDMGVADSYRQKAMGRAFRNIRNILQDMGKDRPFFKYMTPHAASLFSSSDSELLSAPAHTPAHTASASRLDIIDQPREQVPAPYQDPAAEPEQAAAPGAALGLPPLEEVQYLDYRLFVLAAAERLTTFRNDAATIRGAAAEIAVDCDRWLQTKEGRSGVLAFMGVVVSAILPIVFQYYGDTLQTLINGLPLFAGAG